MKSLVWVLASALTVSALAQGKDAKKDASESAKKGEAKAEAGVNWQGQVVKATGSGAPDMKASNPAQARLGAEQAAKMDAFRNLLAQVKGIQISAGKTVGEAIEKDEIRGKVEGVLRGFKVTAKRYFSDSGVEIDVEVPLAALADVITEPSDTKLIVKTDGDRKNTGLVVDARGLKVTPALAPRLLDEAGKPVYAAQALTDDARKNSGVAGYAKSLDEAKKNMQRVGDKPLVLKAAKAQGSDLVLSADEIKKLAEANNSYLAEGRVVIVTN
ncbi:MAG: LPP20 family lipoprotein [Myxococcaceae bacterium]